MRVRTKTRSVLFNAEFEELFDLARPFMSTFQVAMVTKLSAPGEDISMDQQGSNYEECLGHMAGGLLNFIMRTSADLSKNCPAGHIRRLRAFADMVINEAAG